MHQSCGHCWAAHTAAGLSNLILSSQRPATCFRARGWEGTQLGQLTQTEQRYSPARGIALSNKKLRDGTFVVKARVFQRNCYTYRGPASLEVTGHLPGDRKWGINILFLLRFSMQPLLFLLDCFYLNPWACSSFIFLTCWGSGSREQLGLAASWGHHTIISILEQKLTLPVPK